MDRNNFCPIENDKVISTVVVFFHLNKSCLYLRTRGFDIASFLSRSATEGNVDMLPE